MYIVNDVWPRLLCSDSTMLIQLRRLSFGTQIGADSQSLYWAMGALAFALLPHFLQIPIWVPLLIATVACWRITIEVRAWRLPPRWVRVVLAVAAMAAVAITFRTLNGLDAGAALLAAMAGVKLLETRGVRDCTMLILIGYVLLFAALLYDQSLLRLPYILAAAWLLTASLLRLHRTASEMRIRAAVRISGTIVLQALPVAILLFIFFPRLAGQFWVLPARSSAATGLSEDMTPGNISKLTSSTEPAFRVKFVGEPPAVMERYWRGPVLHEFDGRRWFRVNSLLFQPREIVGEGTPYRYRITIEPTQRSWLFALDAPTSWPAQAIQTYDLQLITRRPIAALASFELESYTRYKTPLDLLKFERARDLDLPGSANPRMRGYARELRASVNSDAEFIQAVLAKFRREEFYYTLTPPLLGDDSVDEFLFETRRGFCEHFASAFTALMRAAGIPARVVTGYQGGEYNSLGEYLLVRQSDAHAWSEVWLPGSGWVRVDPTAAVAPQRIERNLDAAISDSESLPGRFMRQKGFLMRALLTWDAVNNFWNDRVVEYNEAKQRSLMELLGIRNANWKDLGMAFAITLALFFAGLSAYLAWQYRPRKRDPLAGVYEKLCRKLARAQLPRAPYEGPTDYLRRVAAALPERQKELHDLQTLYVELRYGPAPNQGDLSKLKGLVKRLAA